MDDFYEFIYDEELNSTICFHYFKDHVAVFRDNEHLYSRPCTEREIIEAWDRLRHGIDCIIINVSRGT